MQSGFVKIVDRISAFIVRSFIPQAVFIVLFMLFDFILSDFKNSETLIKIFSEHIDASIVLLIIIGVGWGLIISFINTIYDKFNMSNFNYLLNNKNCFNLKKLRKKVIKKLEKDNFLVFDSICSKDDITDRELYEILGNDTIFTKLGKTYTYTDKAHQVYVIFTSFILNFAYFLFIEDKIVNNNIQSKIILFLVTAIILFTIAIFIGRKNYRDRNIRLYINYLMEGDYNEREQKE